MYFKYPKTLHLPDSPGILIDQKCFHGAAIHPNLDQFKDQQVIITEKMDGENTTMYRDHIHARSIDSKHHASRDWVKRFHGEIKHMIPEGWRVCGENMFAQHSISYTDLPSYFLGFAIFNEQNIMLDWDNTLLWFKLLGIDPVPVLWYSYFNDPAVIKLINNVDWFSQGKEGYVIRIARSIKFEDFQTYTGKWVRSHHVQTDEHWMHKKIVQNSLKNAENA